MDGATVEGRLTAGVEGRLTAVCRDSIACRVAGPGDDADLRRLLRGNPMGGWVSVAMEREPSYFAELIAGEAHQAIIARDAASGDAVGMCARTVRAAYIDGAGIFTTFWRIILPLARPALITLALLTFQGMWNNFLSPLVFLTSVEMYPLTVGLAFLKGQYGTFYNVVLAGSMFNTIPMVLLFLIFSRFYVQGATYSGVKG